MTRWIWFVTAAWQLQGGQGEGAVRRVPQDYTRITDALAASTDGDVISVAPGTYSPSTNGEVFPLEVLHDVVLCGSGMQVSILDAERTGSVMVLKAAAPRLSGFTLTGGSSIQGGGFLVWDDTAPEIDHNLVLENGVSNIGSGAFIAEGAAPRVHHNVFWGNFDLAPASGGDPHTIQIFNAGGVVEHNVIGRGDSNGLHLNTSTVTIRNNIFFENGIPGVRGRGICAVNGARPALAHNLFFGNVLAALLVSPGVGDISAAEADALSPTDFIYGNQDADPAFVDAAAMNWNLSPTSPAIDAGDPMSPLDPDGTRADAGPFYYPHSPAGLEDPGHGIRGLSSAPNPFAASTMLHYELEGSSPVILTIHDPAGRRVARLVDQVEGAGVHAIQWNGLSDGGVRVAPGVYFARLMAGGRPAIEPLVLVP